ncbi:XRE family transcriptional regulator [Actinosynnema sp. ALI-1.44]|uniref:helix-turn-helix domain-containing protein n=1 Tax=Actinosynnema sp. ALI-1.44 TaxID=1933779 RepID=UPI00097CB0E2|nr:helix-turn-helix transcriptional regulator [Actinosynnema sp. ALI-1.44]ONI87531.1 XRE family transcriptional regulator [Actinosynnema sp. ALI-1.44]
MDLARTLADVGPRLKHIRTERGITLGDLAETTGISKSTLSRLESGQRKPTLELLLPIAQAHQVPLDELVGAPEVGDPRVRLKPRRIRQHDGNYATVLPLTRQPGGLQAFKMILDRNREPKQVTHEGYEWMYVLSGNVRMLLADKDIVLKPGEVVEFDTRLPHWFGSADGHPVEILSVFGKQGEKMHVRARPKQ